MKKKNEKLKCVITHTSCGTTHCVQEEKTGNFIKLPYEAK